jgi:flavin-binding protein dodecin
MSVAKVTEITASSSNGFEAALKTGLRRANKTLKNVTGAWVSQQKVTVREGEIHEYRVTLRVTFILDD